MAAITEEFREKVKKATKKVASKLKSVNADDLEQDVWLELLESESYLEKIMGYEDPYNALVKLASRAANKEIVSYDYFSGNYSYSPGEVKLLLGRLLNQPKLSHLVEHVDLHVGMEMLLKVSKSYHKVIVDKWVHGIEPPHSGRTTEAVDKLTELMNQAKKADRYNHEGPGSRHAVSNTTAQAKTWNQSMHETNGRRDNL